MTQLSPHFSLAELTITQQRGIDNTPPTKVIGTLAATAARLEDVRALLGKPLIISSGYRSPELNAKVGGQKNSQHLTGQAVDFICPGFGTPAQVASAIRHSTVPFDQVIEEFGRWVHISFTDTPRRMALVIDQNGTRTA
jgi:putative chitinase